jgi:hypothetical protein
VPDLNTKARLPPFLAAGIESMPLLCAKSLLQDGALTCGLKPGGLRADAVKTGGREIVTLDEMVFYRDHGAGALTRAVEGHASSSNPRQAPPS